jgi:hypothetical protein
MTETEFKTLSRKLEQALEELEQAQGKEQRRAKLLLRVNC